MIEGSRINSQRDFKFNMTTTIVHLSDFHNVTGEFENYNVVVDALFEDLSHQLKSADKAATYLAFSGDIVQGADCEGQYESFIELFDSKLNELGIDKSKRIIVPGNHDVSQKAVKDNFVVHEGVVAQKLDESAFNQFVSRQPPILSEKFNAYLNFQQKFAELGITFNQIGGGGWALSDEVGVYCLNSAICSSGGIVQNGQVISDTRRLRVDTRSLYAWLQKSKARWKILVLHHPLHWLTEECEKELKIIIARNFSLRLFGHEHEQEMLYTVGQDKANIGCCAPALFSKKRKGQLGYSIISVDPSHGVQQIAYRQWTNYNSFVAGTAYSNTDDGKISFVTGKLIINEPVNEQNYAAVLRHLCGRLDKSLISFLDQPKVWVEPILKGKAKGDTGAESSDAIEVAALLSKPEFTLIKAPPQFGLTCLAQYLVKEAWAKHSKLWLYLDVKEIKPYAGSINLAIEQELSLVGKPTEAVQCLVIDSLTAANKDDWKIVNKLLEKFPGVPLIGVLTGERDIIPSEIKTSIKFHTLFLWPLSRAKIRELVVAYNGTRFIGEDDAVVTHLTEDLDVLNLHRTAFNCLTLLKAYEAEFNDGPVNRSEMVNTVLFLLFNVDSIPTYKARPDLRDCEYVLAYFAETMLRENVYIFSRTHFLNVLQKCCKERLIELEVHVVFDVLSKNNILVEREGQYTFRFAFWIYYFSALRMRDSPEFAKYMLSEMRYAHHPELIEFYTGIDRQRADALIILMADLRAIRGKVHAKCGFPLDMDPYRFAQWTPSDEVKERMKLEIQNGVKASNLPAEIKDLYADKSYDARRPYDQSINILSDSSLIYMQSMIRATAKALRNSDYVDPEIKKAVLEEILLCWEQLTMVLLVLTPTLAAKGAANFDGAGFELDGDFGKTFEERVSTVLFAIPQNVVNWSKEDLFSQKMGPLLFETLRTEKSDLRRHELLRLILLKRPRGWGSQVKNYIAGIPKNSFYLLDIFGALRNQHQFSFANDLTLKEIAHLIEVAMTKHVTGAKDPGVKLVQKTIPKIKMVDGSPIIPTRESSTNRE